MKPHPASSVHDLAKSRCGRFGRLGIPPLEPGLVDLDRVHAGFGRIALIPASLGHLADSGSGLWRYIRRAGIFLALGGRASERLGFERRKPGLDRRNLGNFCQPIGSVTRQQR